jgi:hypothetical protein
VSPGRTWGISDGTLAQGDLRIAVRDPVTHEYLLDQRFSLGLATTLEGTLGSISSDTFTPLASGRVIIHLIAEAPGPHRVNLYAIDNLRIICRTPF